MLKIIGLIHRFLFKSFRKTLMYCYRPLFKRHGKNFVFDPFSFFSFDTIEVGDDVYIGPRANIIGIKGIFIGNKVMFGPNVTILGGDHNTSVIGKYMFDIKEKLPSNDLPVYIEDDVWVGAGATIMKGVKVGTGSIIAAGSIVTKNVDSYSVVAGIPAKFIKKRFDSSLLQLHIKEIKKNKIKI